jgi:hypothetical protein
VLVLSVTQVLIQFIGSLSSWWTRIVIGVLTLIFIGVQTVLANRKNRSASLQHSPEMQVRRKRQRLVFSFGALAVVILAVLAMVNPFGANSAAGTPESSQCVVPPFREEEASSLIKNGAVIAYQRVAGPECVDELFAVYPDGRVVGSAGDRQVESQFESAAIDQLLATISDEHNWFTDEIYSTFHTPCRQCFAHYVMISHAGQEKAITAVDGGTDMPPGVSLTLATIRPFLPAIESGQ